MAGALNELTGGTLVRAHHGSLARAQRTEIEDLLKGGHLRALVATSSLELGIDMGAIDLVIQIEAPPSVASGLQRIGRAGHRIDEISEGIIFPKFRGDLLACAAVTAAMRSGRVESSRYPRNPLDVLAQQLVAMVSMERWPVAELFDAVRSAAPFAELSRTIFDGVLDMLSGRYPSDDFADLRPRLTWDRVNGFVMGRQGAKQVAIANAGTIPDRGLFGVFLSGAETGKSRVGELDEEMVFEARVGETFLLAPRPGASIKSPMTGCWSSLPQANPARCRSGRAKVQDGRSSLGGPLVSSSATCGSALAPTRSRRLSPTMAWTGSRAST